MVVSLLEGAFFIVSVFLFVMLTEISVSIQTFSTLLMEVLLVFGQVVVAQNDLLPSCRMSSSITFVGIWRHCWLYISSFPPFLRETATLVLLLHQVCCSSWLLPPLQHQGHVPALTAHAQPQQRYRNVFLWTFSIITSLFNFFSLSVAYCQCLVDLSLLGSSGKKN